MARRRLRTDEEILRALSDSESNSGDDSSFQLSSLSSSSDSDTPQPPRRRARPSAAAALDSSPSESLDPPMAAAHPAPDSAAPTWESAELYSPQIPEFTANSGIQFDTTELTALDVFQIFVSDDLIAHMVAQTNLYAEQFIRDNPTSSYANRWTPVDAVELRKFWGLTLYMGLVKKPTIRAYWSTDLLYHTSLFRVVMPRTRYEAIQKFIHYNDNSQCPSRDDPQFDCLYKIRPILEHFNAKFAQAYTPEKNISIDESLVHFRGRLKFRQYLPSKRARYGIKVYKLCESTSGYTFKFRIYEGKDRRIEPPNCPPSLGISGKIVWDLVHPLLDQGYHLYLDNFYTSVPLFQCLASRSTVACGTARKCQRSLPKPLVSQLLRRGDSAALCSGNVLCVKYKDKRDVLVLTSIHGHSSAPFPVRGSRTETLKPTCILDYNRYMGGVDLADQVLQPYNAMRKKKAWYKKLSVHLVQMSMYNAYVLYQGAGHTVRFLEFQEQVLKALLFGDQGGGGGGGSTSGASTTRI
ncbi:Transposase IS4, partial [Pristimantis euphronides]